VAVAGLDGADEIAVARLVVVGLSLGRVAEGVEIDPELGIGDRLPLAAQPPSLARIAPAEIEVRGRGVPVAVAPGPEEATHRAARALESDGLVGRLRHGRRGRGRGILAACGPRSDEAREQHEARQRRARQRALHGNRRPISAARSARAVWPGAVARPAAPWVRSEPAAGRTMRDSGPSAPMPRVTTPSAAAASVTSMSVRRSSSVVV